MTSIWRSRFAIGACSLLTLVCAAQTPQTAPAPPALTAHASDSYAIYSLLLSSEGAAKLQGRQQTLAIADTTVTRDEMGPDTDPEKELQPPPGSEQAFAEAVQDYHNRGQEQVQLQHQFKIDRPYRLLTQSDVAAMKSGLAGSHPNLHGYAGVTQFSEVYFNSSQSAALVYMGELCASPCANGRWVYLEKRDGQWTRSLSSPIDRADTYAIYSLLMPGVPFDAMSASQASHFAIAGTTVNINDMNPAVPPDGQLQPPPNNEQAFHEAVQDFYTRQYERVQLQHRLQLDRPYTLLTAGDIAELRATLASIDPGSQLQDKWSGYPGITYFSEVYFSSDRTAALVYMNNFCANLCANGQWIYLEKHGNQWVRRSGLNI